MPGTPDFIMHLVTYVGYPGVTFMVFAESGLPFGFLFPGTSMLFTAGILAANEFFHPWILIPLVTTAAIAGDAVGYWMGHKIGVALYTSERSWVKHEHLVEAKEFYEQYGKVTVLFGRFVPVVRTFIPMVAGIAEMPYRLFLTYNILGAILWAFGMTFAGYYFGTRFPDIEKHFTIIILAICFVSFLPLFFAKLRSLIKEFKKTEIQTEN